MNGFYRRLPLEGLRNARELGGFAFPGGVTRCGVFIRSEVPASLTEGDLRFLRDYGLTTVIDFRGSGETRLTPDVLESRDFVTYINLPMFDAEAARGAGPSDGETRDRSRFSWGAQYIEMAESHKPWVSDVLSALAEAPGTALFHCTTGKDRTGIIAALLLLLCGVPREDVAADYSISQIYLHPMYEKMLFLMPEDTVNDFSDPFFSTAPENIEALLDHLDARYGGAEGYVLSCGTTPETVAALREKLCCEA